MEILKNISLKKFNAFGIDAKANAFGNVENENDLLEVLNNSDYKSFKKLILGGGSNILFTKDYDGLILKNSIPGIKISDEDEKYIVVESGAGVIWNDLVKFCVDNNYGGIENLALIPGTVGAAPIQNIGAYGEELSETFFELDGINCENLEQETLKKSDCNFGYRNSIFKNELKNKFFVTKVRLILSKNPVVKTEYGNVKDELLKTGKTEFTIKDVSKAISKIRTEKLPDPKVLGNAGSFFKNLEIQVEEFDLLKEKFPDAKGYTLSENKIKVPAAWLIEKAGWKGLRKGNVGTHKVHALVIVNYGGATGEEVLHFAKEIKKSVYENFGIVLEEEVNIV